MTSPWSQWMRAAAGGAAVLGLLGLAGCGSSEAPDCGQLAAQHAWVRVAPQGSDVMAAYFVLDNPGDAAVAVNGVRSSQFDRAEMHQTVINDNGQASMQPLKRVTVEAGQALAFKPGGRHVMLFEPSQHYAAGDQVELILACGSQHAELPVAAVVRASQPGNGPDAGPADRPDAAADHATDTNNGEGAAAAADSATAQ